MAFNISRRQILVGGAGTALAGHVQSVARAAETDGDPTYGRKLVFDENFTQIDPAIWFAGPKATTFDTGFYGRSAFSRITGEEGFVPYDIVDDTHAENGKALQIAAKYIGKPMHVRNYYGNDNPEYQWISGNIQTARPNGTVNIGWRSGYFEARMWFPAHPLTFPAFWLMNGRSILYPKTSIELDVVEHKGWELELYGAYLHEWGQPGEHHEGIGVHPGQNITSGYFRYGLSVDGDRCRLYFERKPVNSSKTGRPLEWTIGRSAEMDAEKDIFWPLLTLAIRSDVPVPSPLSEADRQTHMRVDYVRVFV